MPEARRERCTAKTGDWSNPDREPAALGARLSTTVRCRRSKSAARTAGLVKELKGRRIRNRAQEHIHSDLVELFS